MTRYRARTEPAPEVTPAAGASEAASGSAAPEATPRAAGPKVEIPAVQVTEPAAEGRVDISEPTGARDLSDDFDDHVSAFFCYSLSPLSGARQRYRWE